MFPSLAGLYKENEMAKRQTVVGIEGDSFTINGQLTYAGRAYQGMRVEGNPSSPLPVVRAEGTQFLVDWPEH